MWAKSRQSGFTIVELLIVIVVIGILAAITIVAYNGIQDRAKAAAAQSNLTNAAKKVEAQKYLNASSGVGEYYPTDVSGLGLPTGSGATYQYIVNNDTNPTAYCLTTTSGGLVYSTISGNSNNIEGRCIRNYATNPNMEANSVAGLTGPNGSTVVVDTAQKFGNYAARVTMPAASGSNVGVAVYNFASIVPGTLAANTTYSYSMYVYVPTGTVDVYLSPQGSGVASQGSVGTQTTSTKNAWVRLSRSFTTGASGNAVLYILNSTTTTGTTSFWVDNIMITPGADAPATYSDGSSSNWIWTGTSNLSPSMGPSL